MPSLMWRPPQDDLCHWYLDFCDDHLPSLKQRNIEQQCAKSHVTAHHRMRQNCLISPPQQTICGSTPIFPVKKNTEFPSLASSHPGIPGSDPKNQKTPQCVLSTNSRQGIVRPSLSTFQTSFALWNSISPGGFRIQPVEANKVWTKIIWSRRKSSLECGLSGFLGYQDPRIQESQDPKIRSWDSGCMNQKTPSVVYLQPRFLLRSQCLGTSPRPAWDPQSIF